LRILQIDIETAPHQALVWGLFKQNIALNQLVQPGYTLCFAAKWYGEKEIFFASVEHDGAVSMLQQVHALLSEADAVVHYNGINFDIPTLNKEFLQHGMPPPEPFHQIDLLRTARSRFRLASNKLDFVADFLGIGNKTKHKGMDMWVACMAGDAAAWKVMKRYNIQDVKLLEKVYKRILPWIKTHPNHALYTDDTRPVCPNCGSLHVVKCGFETTLTMTYQRYRCGSCHTPIRGRTNVLRKDKKVGILTQSKI